MIKTLIVDDERLARVELKSMLDEYSELEIIEMAENVDKAIEIFNREKPQLLFLDINMPEKTGFDLLDELDETPIVIFTTAYNEYAIKAFEVNALDYLLKPIKPQRLKEAIQKVRYNIENQAHPSIPLNFDKVFIREGDKCWFVKVTDISWIESMGNYAKIYFNSESAVVHKSLNALNQKLNPSLFFRANRQQIFNTSFITSMETDTNNCLIVYLKTGEKIELSRRQTVKFKELMSL